MGVGCQILVSDKWKNRQKKLENAQFPWALKGNFYDLSFNGKNTLYFTILTPITLSVFKIEPENSKRFLNKFKTIP